MTELALFELMSEADCELLARSDVRVNVHRKIGLRVLAIAAIISTLLIVALFVGAFAAVRNLQEQYPEIQGGLVEVLSGVLADEDSVEYGFVKAADRLAAYIKCLEELRSGNGEFSKAKKSIEADLHSKKMPEIEYFFEHFIPSFALTLDELGEEDI